MPDPAWPSSPPEANYLRLAGGGAGGTATTTASGAAWQAVMAVDESALSASAVNTSATAADFRGVGGTNSASAAVGLNTALQLLAAWVQEKVPIAASAVGAYDTAVSSMIPAAVSLANRAEQAADVALNPAVFGALTPAIVALDCEYFGEHWPHNAGIGVAYGATLTALVTALAVPPPFAPAGASPASAAGAAGALAQTAGRLASGEAIRESSRTAEGAVAPVEAIGQLTSVAGQPLQSAASAGQPLMGMFQAPLQALSGMSAMAPPRQGGSGPSDDWELADEVVPAPPGLSIGGVTGGGGAGGVTSGGVGAGGGLPVAGLTSYSRPTSTFAPEPAGRPVGLKAGFLGAAEPRAVVSTGPGGPLPVSASPAGMLHRGHPGSTADGADGVAHARVVVARRE